MPNRSRLYLIDLGARHAKKAHGPACFISDHCSDVRFPEPMLTLLMLQWFFITHHLRMCYAAEARRRPEYTNRAFGGRVSNSLDSLVVCHG